MNQRTVTFGEKEYTLDAHGFLEPSRQWDENFAEGMARTLEIPGGLTEQHWDFIRYIRNKFTREGSVPVVVIACADNSMRLNTLRTLFPTGYHRGACKIAGINFAFMCDHNIWLTYENVPPTGVEHRTCELGFLKDFEQWNEQFAELVVRNWTLPNGLTETHWEIIRYLRDFYRATGNIPHVYETCKANDISLEELGNLFPEGYRRGACRAAGLPFFS